MNKNSRTTWIVGTALSLVALLVFGAALGYVRLAPKIYSGNVTLHLKPRSGDVTQAQIGTAVLGASKQHRDIRIENPRGTSLFKIKAFATSPADANRLAEAQSAAVIKQLKTQLNVDISKVDSGSSPRPVRPHTQAILTVAAIASLNLAVGGLACLVIGFLKARNASVIPEASLPTRA
jgi:hypothetical protein